LISSAYGKRTIKDNPHGQPGRMNRDLLRKTHFTDGGGRAAGGSPMIVALASPKVLPFDRIKEEQVFQAVSQWARTYGVATILGMERLTETDRQIVACVIDARGQIQGCQTKNQLDPTEDQFYVPVNTRRLFEIKRIKSLVGVSALPRIQSPRNMADPSFHLASGFVAYNNGRTSSVSRLNCPR
jgi:hypothetical protein